MKTVIDDITNIFNSQKDSDELSISESSVKEAIRYIDSFDLKDSKSLFLIVAALNLLNAVVKNDNLKSSLYYSYIKSNVSKVADYYISNKARFEDSSVYYDSNRKCFYFNIFEVVFSFHDIKETKQIINVAATSEPIIWPGIRLQQIAQKVFEYGVLLNSEQGKNDKNINTVLTTAKKSTLIPCPDCGKLTSHTAKFCPNCGYDFCRDSEIVNDVLEGDSVQIEVDGALKIGIIQKKGTNYLTLKLQDGAIYRVKYNAITSILLTPNEIVETSVLSSQIVNLLYEIIKIENININENIETNASIQECSTGRVSAISDGGKTIICIAPIGFSKKTSKIGDRLFFIGNKKNISYQSISEMTYQELFDKFFNALRKASHNNRLVQHVYTIINYFRRIIHNNEAKIVLRQIKDKINEILLEGANKMPVSSNIENNDGGNIEKDKEEQEEPKHKLNIIEAAKSHTILVNTLPQMSESECRQVEKELDLMIREGKREKCLEKSYEVITTHKPTPKYLRSYLDRIVNTEIALDHTEKAQEALAILIAFSESQNDTKPNNLSHLYISLARLLVRIGNKEDAVFALDWAEFIYPKNKIIVSNLRQSIGALKNNSVIEPLDDTKQPERSFRLNVVVSGMLIQDVEQYAKSQAIIDSEEVSSPLELFNIAEIASSDKTKSFEFRAQMYLNAAAAYFNAGLSSKTEFKLAVAHYARMKGNSLVAKIAESVQQYPDSQSHLIAECDSARSYYLEALGLYNDLAQKKFLQELLLKYLKIESLASQVEGGKTPDVEWNKGTLKAKMKECLTDDNIESQKVLYRACIAIGSTAERAWNTLANDADGSQPFYNKLGEINFRNKAYELINTMEKSSVSINLAPGEFLRKVFDNRKVRIKNLKSRIEDCLSWEFSPFDISSFEEKWKSVDEYKDLMTATDKLALSSINEVINILKPYAGRRENERYRNLVSSQQILIKSQRMVTETTTYYGRIFFFHLQEKWLYEISRQIEERDASALPKLQISPEPCFIRLNDDGHGVIDFVVTNNGDSTAQSFVVHAIIDEKEYMVSHEGELSAGDSCGESIVSDDFLKYESADVIFKLTAKYQGRDLPTTETEATYEVENGDVLTDEEQIPWKISNTPLETIFKGREEKLTTLISHYLSKDRYMTYILYGLTRTGKTSILDYLCERIEGKHIKEDEKKSILTFKWNFGSSEYKNITRSELWTHLLETCIYDKLSDELASAIDAAYPEKELPTADELAQSDLEIIIDALNNCNIIPLITIDEFSYIRKMIEEKLLDATFIKKLRDISYSGRACFLYAGTYDIKDLPKEYGLTGEMNNTLAMPINEIDTKYANELIDVCPKLFFDEKAKDFIRALSGCVPYWIQWICLNSGKFAVAHKRCHMGYNEINYVIKVMTGEIQQGRKDTWGAIDELDFYNNQIDPNNIAEHQLISSIAFLIRESTHIERGVSMDELNRLWDKFNVDEFVRKKMVHALTGLEERKIVRQFTDETREVYRINVDLFRRWWFVHHRDLKREFSL